jgi:hypothetical protein
MHFLEFLEPSRQPMSIRVIHTSSRQLDHPPGDPLQPEFEKQAIVDSEQSLGDVDAEIRVDPDQLGVKGRMMKLRRCPSTRPG